MCLGLVVSPRI